MLTLGAGCALTLLGCAAGIVLFTAELDEAWILLGLKGFLFTPPNGLELDTVVSSAGLWAALHLIVTWLAPGALALHRVISFLAMALVLWIVHRSAAHEAGSSAAGWLACGAAAAAPGFVFMGSHAFAEPIALLLILGVVTATTRSAGAVARCGLGGLLLGLACATRLAALPMLAGVFLFWLLRPDRTRRRFVEAGATCAIALGVFGAGQALFLAAAPYAPPPMSVVLSMTGASRLAGIDLVGVSNRVSIGVGLLPPGVALVALAASFVLARRRPAFTAPLLLACLGLAQLGAWMWSSPILHLRYSWPGLAAAWIALGASLAAALPDARKPGARLTRALLACLVAGCLWGELSTAARQLAWGESTLISAEAAGLSRLSVFDAFEAAKDERAAVRFLQENVAAGERAYVFELPYPLAYLTGLYITSRYVGQLRPAQSAPPLRWAVLTPITGPQIQLSSAELAWLERDCELRARFGGYAIYGILRGAPP